MSMTYPHCDPRVLHAPGDCEVCDMHPDWQELRKTWKINFTGGTVEGFMICPAEIERMMSTVEAWPGNRPYHGPSPEVDIDGD